MAFPSVLSVTGTAFGTDATAHLVAMPATVNANELLIVVFAMDQDGSAVSVTVPSGWTLIGEGRNGTGQDVYIGVFAKKAVGNEDGTTVDFVSASGQKAAANCYRIASGTWYNSGVWANDVQIALNGNTSAATLVQPPALNPATWGVEDTLWIECVAHNASTTTVSYPVNYTGNQLTTASAGSGGAGTKATCASSTRNNAVENEVVNLHEMGVSAVTSMATVGVRPAAVAVNPRRPVLVPMVGIRESAH